MLLSNTFPLMTDEEEAKYIRHSGSYTVSWYNEQVNSLVAAKHSSVECFMDKNGLVDSDATKELILSVLHETGSFSMWTENGEVKIIL